MFGRFLEISLATDDIAASVEFYERLGFAQLSTGDTWSHPYGVLTDGRVCLGLHQRQMPSPMLSFVRPELAGHLHELRSAGFEPHYTRLGEGDFHELRLHDPAGQAITLLEARTFSPGRRDRGESLCGYFSGYSMPALDLESVQSFWEHAGFVAVETTDEPFVHLPLTSDHLTVALHRPRTLEAPVLMFVDLEMAGRIEQLHAQGLAVSPDLPRGLAARTNALLEAPEGTLLLLSNADT
jgi:catechol 2,3-dioxygenase-like lactoylglutathione lyase family enzyme